MNNQPNKSDLNVASIIAKNDFILMEGAIVETIRRTDDISLHPTLENAPLIYDQHGKETMTFLLNQYISIAEDANLPVLICTPTWRASASRVHEAGINQQINIDATKFLLDLRGSWGNFADQIKIGGLIGPKNDCYKPEEGLSSDEAEAFHAWQIDQLVKGGVDFLIAETIPLVEEAVGIAKAMEKTGLPYFISFVISRDGKILDGTSLADAIARVDQNTKMNPVGFMINCAYPTFLCAEKQPPAVFERLVGYMANASSLDHCDLENAENLESDELTDWGDEMIKLNQQFGVKVLGGCCGTSPEHLRYLAENYLTK